MTPPAPPRALRLVGPTHRDGPSEDQVAETRRAQDIAQEVLHQELVEATFDRADAYGRLGDFDQALAWLDRAAALAGDVPPAYRNQRARWLRAARRRPRAAASTVTDRDDERAEAF